MANIPIDPLDIRVELIENGFLIHEGAKRPYYCADEATLVSKVEKKVRFWVRIKTKDRLPGVDP